MPLCILSSVSHHLRYKMSESCVDEMWMLIDALARTITAIYLMHTQRISWEDTRLSGHRYSRNLVRADELNWCISLSSIRYPPTLSPTCRYRQRFQSIKRIYSRKQAPRGRIRWCRDKNLWMRMMMMGHLAERRKKETTEREERSTMLAYSVGGAIWLAMKGGHASDGV